MDYQPPAGKAAAELSPLVVSLLKSVVYREDKPVLWDALVRLQPQVSDYVAVLGLELVCDESEGYAYLHSLPDSEGEEEAGQDSTQMLRVPRLMARRQLTYQVSLVLALLRKKLAEFDAGGTETRLVLTMEDIVDMVRLFLPESTDETRQADKIAAQVEKIADMGFLRRLRGQDSVFEVRRILKAFVDAQWLSDFDRRLAEYQQQGGF